MIIMAKINKYWGYVAIGALTAAAAGAVAALIAKKGSCKEDFDFEDDFDDFDEESELMFAYAVLKGCRMKALHTEKYEGIVLGVCDKVMAGEIFTDDDTDKNVVSKAALVYSETVRNREYQDYGRGKGGALWS